jgi:4-amino-4-deoxy-L-arabinose transferase-like glycosyltransferase
VSATGHDSAEPGTDAAAAAAWRRRLRADQGLAAPAETDWRHASSFGETADTPAMSSPEISALDFTESQNVGLNGIFHIASTAARGPSVHTAALGASVHTARSSASLLGPLESLKSPRGGSRPASPASAIGLSAPVIDRPRANSQPDPMTPRRRPTAKQKPAQRVVWGSGNQLLLIAILTIQAVLSLRLVWSNTAYIDEATYLWAGHLEIAHWLHGAPVPPFQTWLSGAPIIYPPIAAMVDSIGGLFGARILSLVFMLTTTFLLWSVTSKLFGRRAAFFAAAVFAILGPTQFLGAFATYDAMALLLMATSTWCVVAARDRADSTILLVTGAILLALANATKYATLLFDPVIFVLAAMVIQKRGAKAAFGRAGYLATMVTALVAGLLALGGPLYLAGLLYTTLARTTGHNSPEQVLKDSWDWVGPICLLAWTGVILCARRDNKKQTIMMSVLAAAGMLAPLQQARIHTITSLHKHVDFGAWLAAPAAGYALAQISRIDKRRTLSLMASGLILVTLILPLSIVGSTQAGILYQGWPNSSPVIAQLRTLAQKYRGNYLAEDYDIPAYYLGNRILWQRWSDTWFFSYTLPGTHRRLTGTAAYEEAISHHYFSLVLLDFLATPGTDSQIVADMQSVGGYQIVAVVPSSFGRYTIWAHRPPQQSRPLHGHG